MHHTQYVDESETLEFSTLLSTKFKCIILLQCTFFFFTSSCYLKVRGCFKQRIGRSSHFHKVYKLSLKIPAKYMTVCAKREHNRK